MSSSTATKKTQYLLAAAAVLCVLFFIFIFVLNQKIMRQMNDNSSATSPVRTEQPVPSVQASSRFSAPRQEVPAAAVAQEAVAPEAVREQPKVFYGKPEDAVLLPQ